MDLSGAQRALTGRAEMREIARLQRPVACLLRSCQSLRFECGIAQNVRKRIFRVADAVGAIHRRIPPSKELPCVLSLEALTPVNDALEVWQNWRR
jgi:hypothetical protein